MCNSGKDRQEQFLADDEKLEKIAAVLKNTGISVFEYYLKEDRFVLYDERLKTVEEVSQYLSYLEADPKIYPEDRWKAISFFQGGVRGPAEIRVMDENGSLLRKRLDATQISGYGAASRRLIGSIKDVTAEKKREEVLEEQARRDSLTRLYNQFFGKELINYYLSSKNPYDSCGMMVVDIDYFKNVNDKYGHLFGNTALIELAHLLEMVFDSGDIIMRAGGDEFVVLLKNISHSVLVRKAMQLVKAVRKLTFSENDYAMTCSLGVCYLPENVSGYTYDQLFSNADWALYQAKANGRNRYVFCDTLQRFEIVQKEGNISHPEIDARYLQNDIVATAFEIFEKMNSFDAAIELLLEVIGVRYQLDRITIIRTDIKAKTTGRQYQWTSARAPEVLQKPGSFTKEDFLTLFHSYDEYGTTVLQYDNLEMYSEDAANLLMQGEAKTVLYAAMYCEGQYTGAISYVVCENKRYWSKDDRSRFGELTKIISAHLAKNQAMNACQRGLLSFPNYDPLTGLISFDRFREEVERMIVGGYATSHVVVYSDFENFKYFNQRCGYTMGDLLLKEYSSHVIDSLECEADVYFTRIVADQFLMFMPCRDEEEAAERVRVFNAEFIRRQSLRFPEVRLRLRSGIYYVKPGCTSASAAIDAANYARKELAGSADCAVRLYDEELGRKQAEENEILNSFDTALRQGQFQIYLQPRFSLADLSVVGAEAVVRWIKADGTILHPESFIPLYENNGRIVELDYYVFEQVVAFQAKNGRLGRAQLPISVNASILHARDDSTVKKYLQILNKYGVDPSLLEIELTETATVSYYDNVKKLFERLRKVHMMTSLDDFGAGYSVLNTVIDIPVNTVKIDRAFIMNCESSDRGIYFLQQVIAMVKGLGYHVVCEGVETQEQAGILRDAGCEEAQGYWFARPMPIEQYEKMVYPEG